MDNALQAVPTFGMACPYAEKTMQFLHGIGLDVSVVPGATGFIDLLAIKDGGLEVDPNCPPNALLHDAGHLACMPKQFRGYLSGNLNSGMKRIFEELATMELGPDHPLERALIQCSDPEATAWAYAAGLEVGVPEELIILDEDYEGAGEDIRMQLQWRAYVGIKGLQHAGFCNSKPNNYRPLPVYPKLAFWLQP